MKIYTPAEPETVKLRSGVLEQRQRTALDTTVPAVMKKVIDTGRLAAFRLDWKPGDPGKPHIYWDSDTAKALEGMAAALALRPDPDLEKEYDRWVDLIVSAQQPDGYLNTYFTVVEPDRRFADLYYNHELYCCGHLIEAAVAGYRLLGKRKLLDSLCRYADYLAGVFGFGKRRGWSGHEEIELALLKLYQVTGTKRYLDLARYFLDDRGTEPHYFRTVEHRTELDDAYNQSHLPVREQSTAEGHAVRAVYLYCGMADLAGIIGDEELYAACERIFHSIRDRRMYVTGGIGSSFWHERFTVDYDLANGSLMYAESCAAMGLAMFCSRMLDLSGDVKYAEVMELGIFNGILSGIALDGDKYFYTNYLEVDDNLMAYTYGSPVRQEWFNCSCCPTSYARFLTQVQQYLCSVREEEVRIHIPVAAEMEIPLFNGSVASFEVEGDYPYDGKIIIRIRRNGEYTLSPRVPEWCRAAVLRVNGKEVFAGEGGRYVSIARRWKAGDAVEMELETPVRFLRADSRVTGNLGRVAIRRGPLVYCVEGVDAPCPVRELVLDPSFVPLPECAGDLPAGTVALRCEGWREHYDGGGALYFEAEPRRERIAFRAIPYALWQNRGRTGMAVWLRTGREKQET